MAQMTRLASFGPVFVAAAHPKPPILGRHRRRCCCGLDVVVVVHRNGGVTGVLGSKNQM